VIGAVLLTLLVFALVGQAAWLATDIVRDREPAVSEAAKRLIDYTTIAWEAPAVDATSILRRQRLSRVPWLDALLQRFDLAQKLSRDLRGAGVHMQAAEFLFIQLTITTLAGLAAFLALQGVLGGVGPAAGAALLGFVAPMVWLRGKRAGRLKQFEAELPDTLDLLAGSLRAGYSTPDALQIIARENISVSAEEFGEVVQELNLGADLDAALNRLIERMPSEDARLLISAIAVQRRTGGNLVDVIKQLARTLRERRKLRDDIRVLTTQPRVSGYVVAAIPPIMVAALYLASRKSFDILVTDPVGRGALVGSFVLVVVGLVLSRKISQVDV
jgi:tight adherence protein B